ncbi:MAG: dihydropteroate synthase [Alphaproteobacteria bacterium]
MPISSIEDPAAARGLPLRDADGRIQPDAIVWGDLARDLVAAGTARPLGGGPLAFCAVRLHPPAGEAGKVRSIPLVSFSAEEERLAPFGAPRPPFAGLGLDAPRVMGIVNATPDSFSDGGLYATAEAAVAHGLALRAAGADILDVGGESTRPGATPVPVDEEIRRVVPVVAALASDGAIVSIDTRRAAVMRAAMAAGARIVNDVTALTGEADALDAVAAGGAAVVLMHMQGEPRTMQQAPAYLHAPTEVYDFLARRVEACVAAGIVTDRIAVDPGIGFGKTVAHNLALLDALPMLHGLGCAVLVGVSRKGFLGRVGGGDAAGDRLAASVAAALHGLDRGANIVRVHDVADTVKAFAAWRAFHLPFRSGS